MVFSKIHLSNFVRYDEIGFCLVESSVNIVSIAHAWHRSKWQWYLCRHVL